MLKRWGAPIPSPSPPTTMAPLPFPFIAVGFAMANMSMPASLELSDRLLTLFRTPNFKWFLDIKGDDFKEGGWYDDPKKYRLADRSTLNAYHSAINEVLGWRGDLERFEQIDLNIIHYSVY